MPDIRLNKNICIIETHMKVGQVIDILARKRQCSYIVLRRPKPEANKFWFYVCRPKQLLFWINEPSSFPNAPKDIEKASLKNLIDTLVQKNKSFDRNTSFINLIPFHEIDSAPVVSASEAISNFKNERLYQGSWYSANFPVVLQDNKLQGVLEPVSTKSNFANLKFRRKFNDGIDSEIVVNNLVINYGSGSFVINKTNPITETPIHQAYPDIKSSNEHPVVGDSIDLEVTLKDAPSSTTSGIATLPDKPPEFIYKILVHLLCADTSEWQPLEYSQAKGTIKSAKFNIKAPDITPDPTGDYPNREKLLVRANFYYENRWCGEGRRFLDLRIDNAIPPLNRIPKPPESEWQKCINIEQGTQPADLLVRIQHQQGNKYLWSFLSPYLEFTGSSEASMEIPNGAEAWVKNLFEPYAGIELTDVGLANIEGTGEIIYDSTPEAFRKAYWELFKEAKKLNFSFNSILFISDESCVPWELMRIVNGEVAPEFLGIRHAVGRWIASKSSRLVQNIEVNKFVITGSDYETVDAIDSKLPWVKEELEWLENQYQTERINLDSATILHFLETGKAEAVHFACHGQKSRQNSLQNALIMEDYPENITPLAIKRDEVQKGLGARHPIIFLNACQAAAAGNELGLIVGLPAAFLAAGASAVICPLWSISDSHAKEITELFYQAAFAQPGKTLGEILKTIRDQWEKEHHLTFLAYVLYGDPQAIINFNPQP